MTDNGSVYQRKDKRWCAKYKDTEGRWKYLYRKNRTEAKRALREALKNRDDGIAPSKLTINDTLATWLEEMDVSRRTWINRKSLVRVHFYGHPIGKMTLSSLDHNTLRLYMNSKKELAPSTRRQLLSILKHIGNESVRLQVLRSNPVSDIKAPRQEHKELAILSADQINQLLESIRGHRYELIVVLGATTGLRVGECLGMTWDDIDFDRGTLEIKRTVYRCKIYPPKTRTSRRSLRLPTKALEALRRRYQPSGGYLVSTRNGGPSDPSAFHPIWKKMLENAGLPRETTFHALRHGAASLLLGQNVPIPVVSRYLGHSNPATTMRVYAHMIDGMGGMAADGMDDALREDDQDEATEPHN